MRALDKTAIAIATVGLIAWVGGTVVLDNLAFDSPGWLLGLVGTLVLMGPALLVVAVIAAAVSAVLIDRRDDSILVADHVDRLETARAVEAAGRRVRGTGGVEDRETMG